MCIYLNYIKNIDLKIYSYLSINILHLYMSIKSKLRVEHASNQQIVVESKKLEIKNSINNKYKSTHAMEDLPDRWVFIDSIREQIEMNRHQYLFAKMIRDKYYYFVSWTKPNYCDPDFIDKLSDIKIVTKDDFSMYRDDE